MIDPLTQRSAPKQLKKHDKRTALTASLGFPKFIAAATNLSSELVVSPSGAPERRVLTLPGFPSLPHILLSTFTSTLLPIIPQLEDYECSICGDVAFKPIRLGCGHKFCGEFRTETRRCIQSQSLTLFATIRPSSAVLGQDAEERAGQLSPMSFGRRAASECE